MSAASAPKETRVPEIIGVVTFVTATAILSVIGRFWVRLSFMGSNSLWWDDWLILLAVVISTFGIAGINYALIPKGSGLHMHNIPQPMDITTALLEIYLGQNFYFLNIGLIKLSILFFYLRVVAQTTLRSVIWSVMIFVGVSTLIILIVNIFQCSPVRFAWDQITMHGKCIDTKTFWTSAAAINIVSDILVWILPLKTLWDVKIPTRQRIGLLLIFSIGLFVVLTGILRINSLLSAGRSEDPFWDNVPSALWSTSELAVGIICACLPSLKPLFTRIFGGGGPLSTSKATYSGSSRKPSAFSSASSNGRGGTIPTVLATAQNYDLEGVTPINSTNSARSRDDDVLPPTPVRYAVSVTGNGGGKSDDEKDASCIRKTTNIVVSRVPSPC